MSLEGLPPKPLPNLRKLCQYVYDQYLSKPYSNDPPFNQNQWDREYRADKEIVYRPNHGLAHTLRVAAYAPVVAEFFKAHALDKEKYNFSDQDLEKIQIALLFAVVGRKNEWGFSDNKEEYMKFRADCVTAFKDWCAQNPGKFTESEIDQFGKSILNFGADDMTDPISMMMKTCHKMDLLRCFEDERTSKAMSHVAMEIGDDNVRELLLYADRCIRATGDRICDGHMLGTGYADYNPATFPRASKDPNVCLDLIMQVPTIKPGPILPAWHAANANEVEVVSWDPPPNQESLLCSILINHRLFAANKPFTQAQYQMFASALLGQTTLINVISEIKHLLENPSISSQDKAKIFHNSGILLESLIAQQVPPEATKPLVEYLSDENKTGELENNFLVVAYKSLLEVAKKPPLFRETVTPAFIDKIQKAALQAKQKTDTLEAQAHHALTPRTPIAELISSQKYIQDDLTKENENPNANAIKFANSLKAKHIELLLNIKISDLLSANSTELQSTKALLEFSNALTDSVIHDILNAKSVSHRNAIIKFYYKTMLHSLDEKDLNAAHCIHAALTSPHIQRLPSLHSSYQTSGLKAIANKIAQIKKEATSGEHIEGIPSYFTLIFTAELFKIQGYTINTGGRITPNLATFRDMADVVRLVDAYKAHAIEHPVQDEVMDISHLESVHPATYAQREQKSLDVAPDDAFDWEKLSTRKTPLNDKIDLLLGTREKNGLLNSEFQLPLHFKILDGGSVLDQDDSYYQIISTLKELILEIQNNVSLLKSTPLTSDQINEIQAKKIQSFTKLAIILHAVEAHASRTHSNSLNLQNEIDDLKMEFLKYGVDSNIEKLKKIEQWRMGRTNVSDTTRALEAGPLPKNPYTQQFEDLAGGMLEEASFTINFIKNSAGEKEAIITMHGVDYNLQQIMKHANLNHVKFTDTQKQSYAKMIRQYYIHYPPARPGYPDIVPLKSEADILNLDASFLAQDPSLKSISQAERLAINIYTTGFYTPANAFLRGLPADDNYKDPDYVWELICTTAMAVSGLNGIPNNLPSVTFRAESNTPQSVINARIQAAKAEDVTLEAGFISSSKDMPEAVFGFGDSTSSNNVAIVFKDLIGKDVHVLSAYPHEREVLMPPTQIQWFTHKDVKGGIYLEGKPVTTPLGLSAEILKQVDLAALQEKKMREFAEKIKSATTPQKFLEIIGTSPLVLTSQKGQLINLQQLEQTMTDIFEDDDLVQKIASDPSSYTVYLNDLGINDDIGILSKFLIYINEYKNELDHILQLQTEVDAAKNIDELIATINKYQSLGITITDDPADVNDMLDEFYDLCNDADEMEYIGKHKSLYAGTGTHITSNYGIRNKFIDLVVAKFRFEQELDHALHSQDFIRVLRTAPDDLQSSSGVRITLEELLKKVETILADPLEVEKIAEAKNTSEALNYLYGIGIPFQYNILDHFLDVVQYQHKMNLAADPDRVKKENEAKKTSELNFIFSFTVDDIKKQYQQYHPEPKGKQNWSLMNYIFAPAFFAKGKSHEEQIEKIAKVFAALLADTHSSTDLRAQMAYAYAYKLKSDVENDSSSATLALYQLCDDLMDEIENIVGKQPIQELLSSSHLSTFANEMETKIQSLSKETGLGKKLR